MKKVEVISLIFQSTGYLDFIHDQLERYAEADGYDVSYRVVANDATDKVLNHLVEKNIPHSVFTNPDLDEYYLVRVYRAWNYAVQSSDADIVCLVNSDMAFSPGWLDNLLKHYEEDNVVCSRLAESGKMRSGQYGISMNFGRTYSEYDEEGFLEYAQAISETGAHEGGLFMPCLVTPSTFPGYPEGNVYNVNGVLKAGYYPGHPIRMSGDAFLFKNMQHKTAFDSIVYHIQEGEKDE